MLFRSYVYYDADFEELSKMLSETFQFPIIGVSAMALLDHEGYLAYGMELLVMSADDVRFSVGMTDRLDKDNYEEKLEKLYDAMKGDIQEQEKLILAYTGKVVDADGDIYVKTFDKISGGVPVYGGMPSDMYTYKDFKVFYDGKVVNYAALFATLSSFSLGVGYTLTVMSLPSIARKAVVEMTLEPRL